MEAYMRKLLEMAEKGLIRIRAAETSRLQVRHDGWCSCFKGGECDCDPDIVPVHERGDGVSPASGGLFRDKDGGILDFPVPIGETGGRPPRHTRRRSHGQGVAT